MGRHTAPDDDQDQAPDLWVSGVLDGIIIALVLVITYALLLKTW